MVLFLFCIHLCSACMCVCECVRACLCVCARTLVHMRVCVPLGDGASWQKLGCRGKLLKRIWGPWLPPFASLPSHHVLNSSVLSYVPHQVVCYPETPEQHANQRQTLKPGASAGPCLFSLDCLRCIRHSNRRLSSMRILLSVCGVLEPRRLTTPS